MARDPLNFFQPFENLPPNHENQLTRALLLVLRLCPIAHECWLSRLNAGRHLYELSQATFDTQLRAIPLEQDPEEPLPLVSVFLAPGPSLTEDTVVVASDRKQVLDAIITYPGNLVVVIENKVGDARDWQAGKVNITGVAVKLAEGQKPVPLLWPDLLADFNGILERDLVGGAEAGLLSDFLVSVEDHFPGLGPYQTLRLSARNQFRVARRLRAVLSEALEVDAEIDKWGPRGDVQHIQGTGARVYLRAVGDVSPPLSGMSGDVDTIEFSIYPGDTLTQARQFYKRPKAVAGALELAEEHGWIVRHSFHFGHMQAGYVWTSGDIDAKTYSDLWSKEIENAGAIPRTEWPDYFDWLVEKRIAEPYDREEFDRHFTYTDRTTATPRPGLTVARVWPMHEAEALDETHKLAPQVKAAFEAMVSKLGS